MKKIVTLILAAVPAVLLAAYNPQDDINFGKRPVKPGSRVAKARENMLKKTGGPAEVPNSQKGKVAVLDAQDVAVSSNLQMTCSFVLGYSRFLFDYVKVDAKELASPDWEALKKKYAANVVIAVVNDPKQPSLLVAPDDRWALVNVAKLDKGLASEDAKKRFVTERASKQILRAVIQMSGCLSSFQGSPLAVAKIEELDYAREIVPADVMQHLCKYLERIGMAPKTFVTYRKAVQEGWAPAPKNDYQKAVWDELHALPTKPITIEPEKPEKK